MCKASEELAHRRLLASQQVSRSLLWKTCFVLMVNASRSTMAWGLEARVPFLDKAFLEVAMNVDPKAKMFSKGADQGFDEDGCPKMEKVNNL